MKAFSRLYRQLDSTTGTQAKVSAMVEYFEQTEPEDAAWAIWFLVGNRLSRVLKPAELRQWAAQQAGIPDWLLEECYQDVGDLAETLSLLVPAGAHDTDGSLSLWVQRISELKSLPDAERLEQLAQMWHELSQQDAFPFAKLITGALRVGVSRRLVVRALSQAFALPAQVFAHRLMGRWQPSASFFRQLVDPDSSDHDISRPYPFCLANPLEGPVQELGECSDIMAEWKWDGIRLQLIKRQGQVLMWSRGEERIEDRFPEVHAAADSLPDGTVLDGELLAWKDGRPLAFTELQRRINRKRVGPKLMQQVPVRLLTFDLLEWEGQDLRDRPLVERRQLLEELFHETTAAVGPSRARQFHRESNPEVLNDQQTITSSPVHPFTEWATLQRLRDDARSQGAEGLMLKPLQSIYAVGRVAGTWWKWKNDPITIDAVLIYAQKGRGRRANLFTDYTFALWSGDQLVPFAKAYSGLTDREIRQVDRFVREHTNDRFGPVRSVQPQLVMELAFENIQPSNRHKSGVAVRFPRIRRWRHDKSVDQANSLDELKQLASQRMPE